MFKSKNTLATKIAHTSLISMGNADLRHLQELINNEKTLLNSLQRLSTDYQRTADTLKSYGAGEGDDLNDVLGKSALIMGHISTSLTQLGTHENAVRNHMKSIRAREEALTDRKQHRKSVGTKAETAEKKLSKMSGEHKGLTQQTDILARLREEMRILDVEILTEDAALSDYKRATAKHFLTLKFGAILEFAEKATIVGELGKALIEEIPLQATPPGQMRTMYQGYDTTNQIVREVERCVGEVVFNVSPEAFNINPSYVVPDRASEDIPVGPPSLMGSSLYPPGGHERYETVGTMGSQRGDGGSDYLPSPVAQDMPRPGEFGEDARYGHPQTMPSSAPGTLSYREPSQASGNQFGTFPSSGQGKGHGDRHVSFSQSVQEAFDRSPNLSSVDVSGGPPLDLATPASPQSPNHAAAVPNLWDGPPSGPERRTSWSMLPEDERARNQAAAQGIGLSIFSGPGTSHLGQEPARQSSLPPPPPMPASMPALRSPSPSAMPHQLPEESYNADGTVVVAESELPYHAPIGAPGTLAPLPKPPSVYSTPLHTPQGTPYEGSSLSPAGSTGTGRITAAAFRRGGAMRSPTGSLTDLRGRGDTRQATLPPYDPYAPTPNAYAEDAYNTGSPTDADYGQIGATRVANLPPGSDVGYAQGRFATNLDH
ncbi:Eisosome component PIL1-domain-containing protein [Auriculariales sp. MPI-PUGE-AT-0066]|nr:Eisosome component PIL1-domain-containing protein [Auriculariales sp. MPI-PUGE-AT-0066]